MKLKCQNQMLLSAVSVATRACKGAAMPILTSVLIKASSDDNTVQVTGNCLDFSLSAKVKAEVAESGGVCVPGRRFQSIVAAVAQDASSLKTDARHGLHFDNGSSHFKLLSMDEKEFPPTAEVGDDAVALTFSQKEFAAAINSVAPAQSRDESRYILTAIHVEQSEGKLILVATDGRRLHANAYTGDIGTSEKKVRSVLIPTNAVDNILALLGDEGDVKVTYGQRVIRFQITREDAEFILTSKVVEGNYPNWGQVVPKYDRAKAINVNRVELLDACKRMRLALDEKTNGVKFEIEDMSIKLSAHSANNGEATEIVICKNPTGFKGEVSANVGFHIDVLSSVETDEISLCLNPTSPDVSPILYFTPAVTMVVMPVRFS